MALFDDSTFQILSRKVHFVKKKSPLTRLCPKNAFAPPLRLQSAQPFTPGSSYNQRDEKTDVPDDAVSSVFCVQWRLAILERPM